MATIRIPQDRWAEVWKFLTSIGPITRMSKAPIYEISPQHLEALCHAGLPFDLDHEKAAEAKSTDTWSRMENRDLLCPGAKVRSRSRTSR